MGIAILKDGEKEVKPKATTLKDAKHLGIKPAKSSKGGASK